ncbi:MAG: hypothetical protein AUK33_03915 [Flavobacteriaceae bacterium CG2_30_34_30]|nr:SGNH/GDSL hydrolase family protein [Flavobacteriia bacterium]OIP51617.1 MAG: hypothetical protein AUK33_03915 [Flavobacteriaceae bacterium CG2_30_34_30]PIQ18807.1 MAG: hypothetical protein COW66_04515 [Flavobacteriaceae bacterium CG18_big_fil_WC_8_21_14_2_50_34_36]PIV49926.1 MAG: hypothetical protein COS19_06170 [Flavobacteriaceae bacterium CG02_land_8_20_14_3_00_34_13]PIZ07614.1 MAG: hypothetical protein COY56_08120 [Flavobacteriaceae bacterium CG_4_10_14_0_8_um_filter_34_31]PJC07383.1 MAG
MKKFYVKIGLFLVPVLLVWLALEVFYRTVETNYTYKNKALVENYSDIEVLILSNSQAFYGINPNRFTQNAFSLANISQTLYFDQLLLEKHIDSLPNLKTIILTVSYFTLSLKDNTGEDIWRKYFYNQQMDIEVPHISFFDPRKYSLSLSRKLKNSVETFHEFRNFGTLISCDVKGFGKYLKPRAKTDTEVIGAMIAKKHEDYSMDFALNQNRLLQIIERCKAKNIKVLLVNTPVSKAYYKNLIPEKVEKIIATCNALAWNNANVNYVNFWNDTRFFDADMRDADHLTAEGAEKLSKILNEVLLSD